MILLVEIILNQKLFTKLKLMDSLCTFLNFILFASCFPLFLYILSYRIGLYKSPFLYAD